MTCFHFSKERLRPKHRLEWIVICCADENKDLALSVATYMYMCAVAVAAAQLKLYV